MLVGLLVTLFFTIFLFSFLLDRALDRAKAERDADREERAMLMQRIQDPVSATYEHATRNAPEIESDGMPMSDEQLAEQEERARAIAFIESYEHPREVA